MQYVQRILSSAFVIAFLVAGLAPAPASAADKTTPAQLTGAWVHTNAADMSGIEFSKNGKAFVYYGNANEALTADFSILDDGRLNLSMGGLATFFLPAVSGDQLQLKEAESGSVAQYRRLKPGETMATAIAAEAAAAQKLTQVRNAAVPAFLMRQDLVLVAAGPQPTGPAPRGVVGEELRVTIPTPAALQFAPRGTEYAGRVFFDGKPPRLDAVGAQLQNPQSDTPTVAIWFGPGTAAQNRGTYFFHPSGAAPNITLTYSVVTGGPPALVIKSDPALRAQILDRVKVEMTRLNGLVAPVAAMLKDYAVLKGSSQSPLPSERDGYVDQFVLTRNGQNNAWVGQGQIVNRATGATEFFPVMASVGMMADKPALQVLSQKRGYQFTLIDTSAGKLGGVWHAPNNPQGHPAELAIVQAVDAKGRDQLFSRQKAALLQLMGSGAVFHALLADQYANGSQPPNPVAVTLSTAAGGAIAGKVEYPLEGCTMDLAGRQIDTPLGPQLQLHYAGGHANPGAWQDVAAFINLVQHETWLLSLMEDPSGSIRLNGYGVTNPTPAAPPINLELIAYTTKDKAAIAQALSSGAKFKVLTPKMTGPDDILEFKADPAGGDKIDGVVSAGGHRMNTPVGTAFSGQIKDQGSWAELNMSIARTNSSNTKPVYAYTLVVTPTDAGLYMNGYVYNISQGANHPLGRWEAVQIKP